MIGMHPQRLITLAAAINIARQECMRRACHMRRFKQILTSVNRVPKPCCGSPQASVPSPILLRYSTCGDRCRMQPLLLYDL
jgi:hypothetical protein